MFLSSRYVNARDVCDPNSTYPSDSSVECGLLPNFCKSGSCDLWNTVVSCKTDSAGKIIGPIDTTNCTWIREDNHQTNAPECASSCTTPPPTCPTITCFGNSGAGGICGYGIKGTPPTGGDNVDIGTNGTLGACTSYKCASAPNGVPGHTVSACQSDGCYFNSCECWPDNTCPPPAIPAPIFAPAPFCPAPPPVNNIRVTCPYCGF